MSQMQLGKAAWLMIYVPAAGADSGLVHHLRKIADCRFTAGSTVSFSTKFSSDAHQQHGVQNPTYALAAAFGR